jgi:hypothetical protein
MKARDAIVLGFLVGLGSLQIAADALGMPKVKGFAAALQMSPAMKVFTAHEGYETHAARFELRWKDRDGVPQTLTLDPQSYASVLGPYNRRNVYGAAFAYGPLLRNDARLRPMQESVMRYALCNPGSLRAELGIPLDSTQLTAHVIPVRSTRRTDLELSWEVDCHE